MGNLDDQLANRGSKLLMQIAVNNIEDDFFDKSRTKLSRLSRKHLLDKMIGRGNITWISPLEENHFKEYELSKLPETLKEKLDLQNINWKNVWPSSRQSQWDAIGIGEDNTLVLVEAKAHIGEIESSTNLENSSITERYKRIEEVLGKSLINDNSGNDYWLTKYYQIANRFAFLDGLKTYYGNKRKVLLVFLYFVNDFSLKPTSKEEYEKYINDTLLKRVSIPDKFKIGEDYKILYFDLWKDKGI